MAKRIKKHTTTLRSGRKRDIYYVTKDENTERVNFKLPRALKEDLYAMAASADVSVSQYVRFSIRATIEWHKEKIDEGERVLV